MSNPDVSIPLCRTCNGCGFIWRGRVMQHETLRIRHGQPTVDVRVSRIRDLCPECNGTGATVPRDIQRTPWELVLRQ